MTRLPDLDQRASGLLLHPTSLPGPHGCGDLGAEARSFVDFLSVAKQRWWQVLPVGPIGYGNSPYSAQSAFAGNPLLIDLDALVSRGLLGANELENALPRGRVDYEATQLFRANALAAAFAALPSAGPLAEEITAFREREAAWLDDFALFAALKGAHGGAPWPSWPEEYRKRRRSALDEARRELARAVDQAIFEQFLFEDAWRSLRAHAAARGIGLIGDVPIFVAHDSADVWQHPELFHLDESGAPSVVAGVPPDYFSKTGQRWGNPLYRWKRMKATGYEFWIDRLSKTLERFDAARLDHFIGFHRSWEIPASMPTAETGRWVKGPREDFFETVRGALGSLPLIAEDLGVVTEGVIRLREDYGLPGIKVLQFAFGNDPSAPSFLPHSYTRQAVAYTGTHDNDTTVGWFLDPGDEAGSRSPAQTAKERATALRYLGTEGREIHWEMIRAVLASVANTAIIPVQDLLGLGSSGRMNRPGTLADNWTFRLAEGALTPEVAERLAGLTETYERAPGQGADR